MEHMPDGTPLITLIGATLRLAGRWVVSDVDWCLRQGENWVIWGANGAGKSTLAKALMGQVAVVRGRIRRHYLEDNSAPAAGREVVLVSGEEYHHLLQREQLLDEMRAFSGRLSETTTVADLLDTAKSDSVAAAARPCLLMAALLGEALLAKPLTVLSSGEMRKVLIARALRRDPLLLILDEPFNGLDSASRDQLAKTLETLHAAGIRLVLISHRLRDIPPCFDHLLHLDRGRVVWQGRMSVFLAKDAVSRPPVANARRRRTPDRQMPESGAVGEPLIRMRGVTVRYGDTVVLDRIDWTVRVGEHWALVGPNGAGKTTLLNLITGDNLQGYANALEIFGRPKGPERPLWQIRREIALVGDVLQARFQRRMSGLDVVCSGFHDSVGLYRRCTEQQRGIAREWIDRLGLAELAGQSMLALSFGQQRMLLVARCLVKSPRLLILDEPCNGLDRVNRRQLLAILDRIGRRAAPSLLYVTHRREELPGCITHCLSLSAGRVVRAGPIRFVPGDRLSLESREN